jgi:alpha-beta hydrolase superfamily lysophospholipase
MSYESIRIHYSDGYDAYARLWSPPSLRGAVVYLHGIQSHGLWFEASAQRMAQAGFAVLLPDRRGSGRNDRDRGHTPSALRLVRDVGQCCDELHVRLGFDRFHLVGVSWGGKLALAFHNSSPARVAHLSLIAPGLFPKVDLPAGQKIRVGFSALFAKHALFDIPLQQTELFTENPARQEFIRNDELALRQVTANFLIASRRLDSLASQVRTSAAGLVPHSFAQANGWGPDDTTGWQREDTTQCCEAVDPQSSRPHPLLTQRMGHPSQTTPAGPPLRLFLAGQDRIIDNARTRDFVNRLPWPDRKIIEYPEAHHTLEFELDNQPFLADLIEELG